MFLWTSRVPLDQYGPKSNLLGWRMKDSIYAQLLQQPQHQYEVAPSAEIKEPATERTGLMPFELDPEFRIKERAVFPLSLVASDSGVAQVEALEMAHLTDLR